MTSFESYVKHLRKFKSYDRLVQLQEFAWSYKNATGKDIARISDIPPFLSKYGDVSITRENSQDFSIEDALVKHKYI